MPETRTRGGGCRRRNHSGKHQITTHPLQAFRLRGRVGGRPPLLTKDKLRTARRMYEQKNMTVEKIGEVLGVSRTTVYRALRRVPVPVAAHAVYDKTEDSPVTAGGSGPLPGGCCEDKRSPKAGAGCPVAGIGARHRTSSFIYRVWANDLTGPCVPA